MHRAKLIFFTCGFQDTEKVYKNIDDFLFYNYQWIQQESTFWKRELWNKTGAYIDTNYEFMVDGELWTRFFFEEKLWHYDRPIGGYRSYGLNRALLNKKAVNKEMIIAIDKMLARIENGILETKMKNNLIVKQNTSVKKKIEYFKSKKILKLLPNFLYYKLLLNIAKEYKKLIFKYNLIISKDDTFLLSELEKHINTDTLTLINNLL